MSKDTTTAASSSLSPIDSSISYRTRSKVKNVPLTPALKTVTVDEPCTHTKSKKKRKGKGKSQPKRPLRKIRIKTQSSKKHCQNKIKLHIGPKSPSSTEPVVEPTTDMQTSKQEQYKANISKGAQILTHLLLSKSYSVLGKNSHSFPSEDEDYIDIEGIPDEIDYVEEEHDYLTTVTKEEQQEFFSIEKDILKFNKAAIPQRFRILKYNVDLATKAFLLKKLDLYYSMEPTDNEYAKLGQWIEYLDKIPFGKYTKSTVSLSDHPQKIVEHLFSTKKTLDKAVFGHAVAKNQIIQLISQHITNPECSGNCIAIQGPPGNGKTTLVREGIAKSLNRPFYSIPLGGMKNADFLLGHDYTYEGSKPGRIVEILMQAGTMDPVIYFDELDKLSDTPRGHEIANLLCHLTDLSQNSEFHDKYFSGLKFDLSKALFIFSYNHEEKVNRILLDRMIKIRTKGFKICDKIKIAKQYLFPSVASAIGFPPSDCSLQDSQLRFIIETYTQNEKGVRNLRRCLETILSKLNVLKLLHNNHAERKDTSELVNYNIVPFSLPITLQNDAITKLLADILPPHATHEYMYT